MTINSAEIALAIAAIFALPGSYCGEVLDDPSFEMWCEDQLCSWQVEEGAVEKVPTWHRRDFGVALVGEAVAISQLSTRTSADLDCLHLHLLANVAEDAAVTLELDFYDDGEVDYSQVIPTSDWALLSYFITLPSDYQGIRFRIRKQGGGEAVLAEISAADSDDCSGAPMVIGARPDGATCSSAEQCLNASCEPRLSPLAQPSCGECTDSEDCGTLVCGLESSVPVFLSPYRFCTPAGHHGLGEICVSDEECTTGTCCQGTCSTCCDGAGCSGAGECQARAPGGELAHWETPPHQCNPEGGSGAAGTACLTDSDCASATCSGSADLRLCLWDGRACSSDSDCPADLTDIFSDEGHCAIVGTERGSCQ